MKTSSHRSNYLPSLVLHPVCCRRTTQLTDWLCDLGCSLYAAWKSYYMAITALKLLSLLTPLHSYKWLSTPMGFCLFDLSLAIFATLEIKAEKRFKYYSIHSKVIINPIHVKQIIIYSMKNNYFFQNKTN